MESCTFRKAAKSSDVETSNCHGCREPVQPNAATTYMNHLYHPHCMICSDCNNQVVVVDGKLSCASCLKKSNRQLREKSKQMDVNKTSKYKCTICHLSVLEKDLEVYNDKGYHSSCMRCSTCRGQLHINKGKLQCASCKAAQLALKKYSARIVGPLNEKINALQRELEETKKQQAQLAAV